MPPEKPDFFQMITVDKADPNNNMAWGRLLDVIEAGNLQTTRKLLEGNEGINVDTLRGYFERTLLHRACVHENLQIVKYLVQERNASVHTVACDGWTPLYETCVKNGVEITEASRIGIAEFLLANGADVNAKSLCPGGTALHQACSWGSTQLIRVTNAQNIDGDTPLYCASSCMPPRIEVIKLLLDNNADCHIKVNCGEGPVDLLREHGLEHIIEAYDDKRPLAVSGAANVGHGTSPKKFIQHGTMVGINPSLSPHQHALAVKSILLARQLPVHEVTLEILGFLTPASVRKLFAV